MTLGKSMSTIRLTHSQWRKILAELHEEHPRSVFLIRDRMKERLGFVAREHSGYRMRTKKELADYDRSDKEIHDTQKDRVFHRLHKHESLICLDFYSERKYTMFLLKFSEQLNGDSNDLR